MALLWKMICNLGDPMSLRHPVGVYVIYSMTYVNKTAKTKKIEN